MDKWTIIIIVSLIIGVSTMIVGLIHNHYTNENTVCEDTCDVYYMNLTQPVISERGLYCECHNDIQPSLIVEAIR